MRTTGKARWGLFGLLLLLSACGRSSSSNGDDDSGAAGESGAEAGGSAGTAGKSTGGASAKGGGGGKDGGVATGGGGGTGGGNAGVSGVGGTGPDTNHYLATIRQTPPAKLDLLFMIDNSLSMTAKQQLLAQSIPVLIEGLVSPPCVDEEQNPIGPPGGDGSCPVGAPEFAPLRDLHIGVITSSLGDHGSNDLCSRAQNESSVANGGAASDYDDLAQLLPTVRPQANLYSWNDSGFLVWASGSNASGPIGTSETEPSELSEALAAHITAAGERGCGYEASLEAWYRFLIDPAPPSSITNDGNVAHRGAVNEVLLAQRRAFLRSDSLLSIVMLTDENDCSIIDEDGTQGWLVGYKGGVNLLTWKMPRASSACADPNSACCRPCSSAPPVGCPDNAADPACSLGASLTLSEDSPNLRCFRQQQRFGIDLLYPTERYVEALRSPTILPRFGGVEVQNPLFVSNDGAPPREPSQVILAGLVGVPWQDLARDLSNDVPLTYLNAAELVVEGRWDVVLGDPAGGILPTDDLMVDSVEPRHGVHPLTGAPLTAETDTTLTNPINGHEQAATVSRDELQFACIFPLPEPVPCDATNETCPCHAEDHSKNSPLCTGVTANEDGIQLYEKAYPSLRELEVLKGIGEGAVVASICPKSTTTDGASSIAQADYGYNPFVRALIEQIKPALMPLCFPRSFAESPDGSARIACTVTEAVPPVDGSCDCAAMGRREASEDASALASEYLKSNGSCDGVAVPCDSLCYCEIPQLDGDALAACQSEPSLSEPVGFCYVDPENGFGDEAIVAGCPESNRRLLRFIGEGVPSPAGVVVLDCGP